LLTFKYLGPFKSLPNVGANTLVNSASIPGKMIHHPKVGPLHTSCVEVIIIDFLILHTANEGPVRSNINVLF
jgi:hypothetical protein